MSEVWISCKMSNDKIPLEIQLKYNYDVSSFELHILTQEV